MVLGWYRAGPGCALTDSLLTGHSFSAAFAFIAARPCGVSCRMGHGNYDLWKAEQLQYDKEHRAQAHGLMLEICKRLTVKAVVIVGAMTIYQRFLALVSFTKINLHVRKGGVFLVLLSSVSMYTKTRLHAVVAESAFDPAAHHQS